MNGSILMLALALCIVIACVIAAAPLAHAQNRRNVANALRQGSSGALGTRGHPGW